MNCIKIDNAIDYVKNQDSKNLQNLVGSLNNLTEVKVLKTAEQKAKFCYDSLYHSIPPIQRISLAFSQAIESFRVAFGLHQSLKQKLVFAFNSLELAPQQKSDVLVGKQEVGIFEFGAQPKMNNEAAIATECKATINGQEISFELFGVIEGRGVQAQFFKSHIKDALEEAISEQQNISDLNIDEVFRKAFSIVGELAKKEGIASGYVTGVISLKIGSDLWTATLGGGSSAILKVGEDTLELSDSNVENFLVKVDLRPYEGKSMHLIQGSKGVWDAADHFEVDVAKEVDPKKSSQENGYRIISKLLNRYESNEVQKSVLVHKGLASQNVEDQTEPTHYVKDGDCALEDQTEPTYYVKDGDCALVASLKL